MTHKKKFQIVSFVSFVVIALVSWHSVQEIHYLKTFFPKSFSVAEAYDASLIELIKLGLISFPLMYLTILVHRYRNY